MRKVPLIGVSVVLIKDKKLLLGLRTGSHGENSWGMPGGHIKWKETFFDCAKREVREEIGIEINCLVEQLFVTNDYFEKEDKHYITIFIIAEIEKGVIENKEPHKCIEWRWFNFSRLPRQLFLPVKNLMKQEKFKKLIGHV